jgi:hypothetical protein
LNPCKLKYEKESKDLMIKMNGLRQEMNVQNEKTSKSTREYAVAYSSNKDDMYLKELIFINHAGLQMELEEKLGKFSYQLYLKSVQQEIERYDVIKKVLTLYSDALRDIYGIKSDQSYEMIKGFQTKEEIEKSYLLQNFLEPQNYENLKRNLGELDIPNFEKFLSNFSYPPSSKNPLILYEGRGTFERNGHVLGSSSCTIILTVDKNYLFYEPKTKNNEFTIHRVSPLSNIEMKTIQPLGCSAEFSEFKKGFFGKSHTHLKVTFQTKELRDEFVVNLEKYKKM